MGHGPCGVCSSTSFFARAFTQNQSYLMNRFSASSAIYGKVMSRCSWLHLACRFCVENTCPSRAKIREADGGSISIKVYRGPFDKSHRNTSMSTVDDYPYRTNASHQWTVPRSPYSTRTLGRNASLPVTAVAERRKLRLA